MSRRIMILDAYNILHRNPSWKPLLDQSLEGARETLLNYCRRWMATRKDVWLFVVVFDGNSAFNGDQSSAGPGVRVMYSASGESADDRILEVVREFGERFDYVVVSDDRYVTGSARQLGAAPMKTKAFTGWLDRNPHLNDKHKSVSPGKLKPEVHEDALPPGEADQITASLRRLWEE